MRTAAKMAVLALGIAAGSLVWAEHQDGHEHGGWFDTDACQICKPLSEPAGLLASMKWETHTIHDGMLMVAIVPEAQKKTYGEACAKMDKAVQK